MNDSNPEASQPEHVSRPRLRPVQVLPTQQNGKTILALRDPLQLAGQTMAIPPQALGMLQHFRGEKPISEIAEALKAPIEKVLELAVALDRLGLLEGPTAEALEDAKLQQLHDAGHFPPRATQGLGNSEIAKAAIRGWFAETEDPELSGVPVAVLAPSLSYSQAWEVFAGAWHPVRSQSAPDRVVVLGPAHASIGNGVCGTQLGIATALGVCPVDQDLLQLLRQRMGDQYCQDELDHFAEHGLESQLPWIQEQHGNIPVTAAILPDRLLDQEPEDGVSSPAFISAMGEALSQLGGRTLLVVSTDLAHAGPQFGEPRAIDDNRRVDVEQRDRELLGKFLDGDADAFVEAVKWDKNALRWTGVHAMSAALQLTKMMHPEASWELVDYKQADTATGQQASIISIAGAVATVPAQA
ncbi:MAG: AmmeMemoRadiSam system protein B [Planctomycetota bacterium]|nr:AmmeMemoRadiSam system protein B [Planctomycetota bacterium]MEC8250346.1 AmmeMemoRadiSam system protein B [Planctomycetota bacterium]MEC8412437.1 AmmeMemoRadiSam system protein B [Planctomycetota bacterium]MEC8855158.1 AmmeMemoRadiSam system protein B [Planctomycetota bacterium]MED5321976.1 AmmeMemoRadiSam system protein B [Planctomycetota bacterium]